MKPKKRYQQTQSGRLFMRDKDHRDIVYQDKYHNALLWKDKDGKESTWVRYPRKTCLCWIGKEFVILDVDRRCVHFISRELGQRNFSCIFLEDLAVLYNSWSYNEMWMKVSEDGQIWNPIEKYGGVINTQPFSRDCTFGYSKSSMTDAEGYWEVISIEKVHYYKDVEGAWKREVSNASFRYKEYRYGNTTATPIGYTHNGIIVAHDLNVEYSTPISNHNVSIFLIDNNFNQTYLGEIENISGFVLGSLRPKYYSNAEDIQFCQKGSFMAMIVYVSMRVRPGSYSDYWQTVAILFGSADNGATWSRKEIFRGEVIIGGSSHTDRFRLIYRKDKFYCYAYDNGNSYCMCYSSTNGIDWYQVNLPEYVDVPIEQNPSGYYSSQYPAHQSVRLKVLQSAPSGSDANANFIDSFTHQYVNGSNENTSLIDFLNGEQTNVSNKEEHLCFIANGYLFYFDNMALVCNDYCYAIQLASTTDEQSFEHLMEGDYCYRGTTPPEYPYWNPYTQYNVGDIVIYGDKFECLIANKNQVPREESIYWRKKDELYTDI